MNSTMATLRLCAILVAVAAAGAAAFSPSQCARSVIRLRAPSSPSPPSSSPPFFRRGGRIGRSSSSSGVNDFDDFADFSSTKLTSSNDDDVNVAGGDIGGDGGGEDSFLSSLQSRMEQVQDQSNRLPLMILDTMLPRQILQIQIQHPTLKSLMKHRVGQETPTLGMLGMARLSTGQTVPLKSGVEVEIIRMDKASEDEAPRDTMGGDEPAWDISLRAGRRFVIEGEVDKTDGGWTEAQVKFLDSQTQEEDEVNKFSSEPSSAISMAIDEPSSSGGGGGDRLSVARAMSKSKQFTEPNMNVRGGLSLVDRWIELAKENERHPGQIDALLVQLGEMPPEHEPTERALWVGALINPLPAMGVAMEIRPALLVSKSAEERVQVALEGILKSIRHMDGSARLW